MELHRYAHFINGEWVDPTTGDWFESHNPYTGQPWALIPRGQAADGDQAVEAAHQAFTSGSWSRLTPTERGKWLVRLAEAISERAEPLAQTESTDNGKLITEMSGQLHYIPEWFRYFGGLADKIEGSVPPIDKPDTFLFTRREPLGVIVAIIPWNSPLLIAAWKLAPALAAGNTVVLKPSEWASASSLEFAKVLEEIDFPKGAINVVTGYGHEIGPSLLTHPKTAKITFTGGEEGGRAVATAAAHLFKPVVLELGGKSPNIVFEDAELDNAVKGVISGIFAATGQTCIAGSRLLVQASIHDQFVEKLVAFAKTAQLGNPLLTTTQVGPVTTPPQYEKILRYIDIAKQEGANCVLGGGPAPHPEKMKGLFVQPTIFTQVTPEMRIAQEEVFGPVLSVLPFHDEEEAWQIANSTPYGLAAGVWTQSNRRALAAAQHLDAGTIWVNTYRAVSYVAPFGGYKQSGFGRESGQLAIDEFLQTKSVWISTATEVANPFVMR